MNMVSKIYLTNHITFRMAKALLSFDNFQCNMTITVESCCIWQYISLYCFIATNQRVVAAQRQQRGFVAVTIRGSVLF